MDYMTIDELKRFVNNKYLKEGTILFPRTYNEDIGSYIVYNDSVFYNQAKSIINLIDFKEDEIFRVKTLNEKREGYNTNLFEIKCLKCGSLNCSIDEATDGEDDEGNPVSNSGWYIYCHDCQSSDI